jgi:hypothetical protein
MRFDLHTKRALRPAFKLEARRLATHHFLERRLALVDAGGCWRLLRKTKQNREKNNTTISFGENQKASETKSATTIPKVEKTMQIFAKRKFPNSLSLSHTHTLSLSQNFWRKKQKKDRTTTCV